MPYALLTWSLLTVGGFVLCGVACAAPNPPAEQALQDGVDHWGQAFSDQVRLFDARFRAFEEQTGVPDLAYVLGVETALRKTFPTKYWFKGQVTDRVALSAARNEAEAFQLAILPKMGQELHDVTISVSGIKGGGHTIPAAAFEMWRVGFVETAPPPYPTRHIGRWPDPLLELEPFSVTGADLGLVWCEIKVPADTPAGDYTGTIEVAAAHVPPSRLTVTLHVWDFALPDRVPMPMFVWTREKTGQAFLDLCTLLLRHHVDPIQAGNTMDLNELDRNLEFCLDRGLTYFQTPPANDPDAFRPYYEHIKQRGWLDRALTYGAHDEPLVEQFEEIVVPQTRKLREAFPGLRVFLAGEYHPGMARGTDVMLIDLSTNFHKWLDAGRPGAQELWWYFCGIPVRAELRRCLLDAPRMLLDRDAIEHRVLYWMAHHYGVKGMFTYAGTHWPKGNENWPETPFQMNETMHYPYAGRHNGDGFIVYPGPRPSIRLKAIRDGAEDYWYLSRVGQLAQSPRHAQAAQALLDGIVPELFVDTHYYNRDPGVMLDYRRRLGAFIEAASDTG